MPQLVDQVVVPRPRALGTLDQFPRVAAGAVAAGSVSDLVPPPVDDHELGELAVPADGRVLASFGGCELVIERSGDRVALVLPGLVRLLGTAAEAAALAALLSRPR